MEDDKLAKELLTGVPKIKSYQLTLSGKPDEGELHAFQSPNSFEEQLIYKFSIPIRIDDDIAQIFQEPKNRYGYIFTNWHIENQHLKRKYRKKFVSRDYLIYEVELIDAGILDITYEEDIIPPENPFDMRTLNFSRRVKATSTLVFKIEEFLVHPIVENLKQIYYIPQEEASGKR